MTYACRGSHQEDGKVRWGKSTCFTWPGHPPKSLPILRARVVTNRTDGVKQLMERWKRTTRYFNATNVSANRLGRLGCWIVAWQSFSYLWHVQTGRRFGLKLRDFFFPPSHPSSFLSPPRGFSPAAGRRGGNYPRRSLGWAVAPSGTGSRDWKFNHADTRKRARVTRKFSHADTLRSPEQAVW